jgi:hypothetical protein
MSIELFREILAGTEKLRLFMERETEKRMVFNPVNTGGGIGTVPVPALINALERNIDMLAHGGYGAGRLQPTMTWQGEVNDVRRLDFSDVNRWLESIEVIDAVLRGMLARMAVVRETIACGDSRQIQSIRSM